MKNLSLILRLNATSCFIFGLLFTLRAAEIVRFLSPHASLPTWLVIFLGACLILNGIHLLLTSFQAQPAKLVILYFSLGDILWVLATIVLIALQYGITSFAGIVASLLVAVMVGTFGSMQLYLQKKRCKGAE